MNDEKLDKIFEEAFKVEYRKEFKQELKDVLLKEYDKRKKGKFFLKISTMIAACIVLVLAAFGSVRFDLMGLNVRDTSVVKTEVEKAFPKQDAVTEQQTEQNNKSVSENDDSLYASHGILKNDEVSEKKETQDLQQSQSSSANNSSSQGNFNVLSGSDSKKSEEKVSKEVGKAGSNNSNNNENVTSKAVSIASSSLPSSSTKKVIKSEENDKVQENIKTASEQSKNNTLTVSMIVPEKQQTLEVKKDLPVKLQEESVFKSVYVLKEKELKVDEKSILDALGSVVSSEVYAKKYFSSKNLVQVQVQVYDEYFNFKVVRNDFQVSAYQLPEEEKKESVLESVYAKTELILKEIGIKDYMVSVIPKKYGYRAEINLCFDDYKIYGLDSYIDYSKKADIIGGEIYLKTFSKLKTIRIMDEKTAAKEFEKKYNLKNVKPSDVSIVYKKTENIYFPTYIYIHENKIYWLEK